MDKISVECEQWAKEEIKEMVDNIDASRTNGGQALRMIYGFVRTCLKNYQKQAI